MKMVILFFDNNNSSDPSADDIDKIFAPVNLQWEIENSGLTKNIAAYTTGGQYDAFVEGQLSTDFSDGHKRLLCISSPHIYPSGESTPDGYVGVTQSYRIDGGYNYSLIFIKDILTLNIWNVHPLNLDVDASKKCVSKTVYHELGHLLGEDFLLGHDNHNGFYNNKLCVMYQNQITSTFTYVDLYNIIEAPHFCEGHIQRLLNTIP